ncbi:sulfite exporter TauE/SafE family protein [uncultured Pseudokineococcus sp.]|uniref:sulfite exporter TauE/SafE family protein n=1 Tax=uncultured Pseudokineococcus sp. TaxID=1642928 RepID=UPI00261E6A13|nr:sulfite exporter TauE/SafE family protein [uncultured Pseudokineococcus sp.]
MSEALLGDLTGWQLLVLAVAAVWAGAINAVVGSGTLVTFPTLVALGVPPVSATMSNAVGLVTGGISGTWGYRRELRGQGARAAQLIPMSVLGALLGAFLLLHLPATTFETVVPVLVVLAIALVLLQPRLQARTKRRLERRLASAGSEQAAGAGAPPSASGPGRTGQVVLLLVTFLIGIYGGYFTAAQGILLVGAHGALLVEPIQRLNAMKNLLSLVVNVVAATAYVVVGFDRIVWEAVLVIAVGSLVGGLLGASIGRRLPNGVLRATIVVLGVVALVALFVR